ncbi:MAG TPA: CNNM domain-containing protein [Candidatus Omnitrophota bacterium]|nr:hypothetical protein [Candidatus Omnitrophota bacterium]HRK62136.1 CNNM domain-containing protein [Candidatus Omnitrophota bacterium]
MISVLAFFVLLLIFSAFLSATEMAFVSINPIQLRQKSDGGDGQALRVLKLRNENQHFLGALLIANNLCNAGATMCLTYFLQNYFGISSEWIVTALMLPLLVVFCEMSPKEYGRVNALGFLTRASFLLWGLHRICFWIVDLFIRAAQSMLPILKQKNEQIFLNETEFKALVSESEKQGVLEPHEKEFVHTILDFERIPVKSVMIPLNQTAQVELCSDLSEVRKKAREGRSKMVLVYEEAPEIVAGVIYVFDLLAQERENGPLTGFLKAPLFISEKMSLEEAFRLLQKKRQSFALVTDASYEVQGVVLIENLLLGKQA